MRALRIALAFMCPALTGGAMADAQAVDRTDMPGRGMLRVTFEPRIVAWDAQFVGGARLPLGLPLTGDTVGGAYIPVVARLQQDVRTAGRLPGFIASLGKGLFSVRQERRTTPIRAELGLTDRLSVSLTVPIVRVATRAHLQLSSKGANLGLNPLLQGVANSGASYGNFFSQFDTSLARLDVNIAGGGYGCPPSRQCAAQPFLDSFRFALGDVEVAAKYRIAGGAHYAAALVALVRLPTARRDSAEEWLHQSIGDHQLDLEARLVQELIVGSRLWLNLAIHGGIQRPGTQVRRVAPFGTILVPIAATTELRWDPGDYAGVDFAPLFRLAPQFAAGVSAGYWTKQRDRYAFRSPLDSLDLASP